MAKAIWTGSLSFGLVNVPVGLYSATEDRSIHFNQFRAGTSERIRNKRVSEQSGEEVAYGDIVKGYDLGGGEYVILTPEELASVAPGPSRTIEVTDFVELADIDPIYFDKPYFLAPHGKNGDRAYELLRRVMAETNKVAIAHVRDARQAVPRRRAAREGGARARDAAVRGRGPRPGEGDRRASRSRRPSREREIEMAKLLIDSMTTAWEPETLPRHLPRAGRGADRPEAPGHRRRERGPRAEPAPVVDLLAALQASVTAAKSRQGDGSASGDGDAGEKPAKKPAARRPRAATAKAVADKEASTSSGSRRRKAS